MTFEDLEIIIETRPGFTISDQQMKLLDRLCKEDLENSDVRTPKRGEIVEVTDDERDDCSNAQFVSEIEDYRGYKYIANDGTGHPTAWKKMRQKKPKEETIYVPDSIKIEICTLVDGDNLCINNNKQSLYFSETVGYMVGPARENREVKCKLIPIDVKDLEVGGTYFHSVSDKFDGINDLSYYCKYLGKRKYVRRGEESVYVTEHNRRHRYKVVPID